MASILRLTARRKMVLVSFVALLPVIAFAYVSLQENVHRVEQLNNLLVRVLSFNPAFTTIIVSSNDSVVLGVAQTKWAQPMHIIDRSYSRDSIAKRDVPVYGRLVDYSMGEPRVAIAVPSGIEDGQRSGSCKDFDRRQPSVAIRDS